MLSTCLITPFTAIIALSNFYLHDTKGRHSVSFLYGILCFNAELLVPEQN